MTTTLTIGTAVGTTGTGTITLTNASAAVTGLGTLFTTELRDAAGNPLFFEVSGVPYQVLSIASDTALTLQAVYGGTTASGLAFTRGGRNFSTLQGFASFLPATLADNYIGECYNDSEFATTTGVLLTLSGNTTTATFNITLTTAAGQSFADNANAQTNALTYNQANGVGCSGNFAYANVFTIGDAYVTISKLQVKSSAQSGYCVDAATTATNLTLNGCIVDATGHGGSYVALFGGGQTTSKALNCLFIFRSAGDTTAALNGVDGWHFANCTIVAPSDLATKPAAAFNCQYTSTVLENCAIFGYAAFHTGVQVPAYTTCASDLAAVTGVTGSLTYTSQFQNTTNAASDYRLVSGAALIDTGTTDTTDIPAAIDIVGTSRPQGSAWDIGAWEFRSGVVAASPVVIFPLPF